MVFDDQLSLLVELFYSSWLFAREKEKELYYTELQ
jgi:hypothetical protein